MLIHLLTLLPSLERGLVMVQAEVADRLAAGPGSKTYGVPSVKAAWFADVRRAGAIGRTVFWPAPNVDSGLVAWTRRDPPDTTATRQEVFAVVDAAFAQRRKQVRAALRGLAGSAEVATAALESAGVDPTARGEVLTVEDFARIAEGLFPLVEEGAQRPSRDRGVQWLGEHHRPRRRQDQPPPRGRPGPRRRLPPARHRLPGDLALRRRDGAGPPTTTT